MTNARAKVWARLIHKGHRTIEDVPEADRDNVRVAYRDLFKEEINND